jgi:hypothetical protein
MNSRTEGSLKIRFAKAAIAFLAVLSALLVVVEDGLTAGGASWSLRERIELFGAALDAFFTLNFALRFARGLAGKKMGDYFLRDFGWADAAASLVPLIFISGPLAFSATSSLVSHASITAWGSFRLLREFRLLRFLRLICLIGPSHAAHRLVAARGLAFSLAALLAVESAAIFGLLPDTRSALAAKREASFAALALNPTADGAEALAAVDRDLLLVRAQDRVIYTRYSAEVYSRRFGVDEIGYLRSPAGLEAFFSIEAENRAGATVSLALGLSCLAAFLALGFGHPRQEEKER